MILGAPEAIGPPLLLIPGAIDGEEESEAGKKALFTGGNVLRGGDESPWRRNHLEGRARGRGRGRARAGSRENEGGITGERGRARRRWIPTGAPEMRAAAGSARVGIESPWGSS